MTENMSKSMLFRGMSDEQITEIVKSYAEETGRDFDRVVSLWDWNCDSVSEYLSDYHGLQRKVMNVSAS